MTDAIHRVDVAWRSSLAEMPRKDVRVLVLDHGQADSGVQMCTYEGGDAFHGHECNSDGWIAWRSENVWWAYLPQPPGGLE